MAAGRCYWGGTEVTELELPGATRRTRKYPYAIAQQVILTSEPRSTSASAARAGFLSTSSSLSFSSSDDTATSSPFLHNEEKKSDTAVKNPAFQ